MRLLADAKGCTPGQVALAWLLAQQTWIVPIPGTRRRERVDENAAASQLALSADEVAGLDTLAARVGVRGDRYSPAGMSMVGLCVVTWQASMISPAQELAGAPLLRREVGWTTGMAGSPPLPCTCRASASSRRT